jgi:hypothetical protein
MLITNFILKVKLTDNFKVDFLLYYEENCQKLKESVRERRNHEKMKSVKVIKSE